MSPSTLLQFLQVAGAVAAIAALVWAIVLHRRLKRSADELKQSQAFLERLFLQSPFPMWVADRTGTLLMMSHATERLFEIADLGRVVGRYNALEDSAVSALGYRPHLDRALRGETVTISDVTGPGQESWFHSTRPRALRTTISPVLDARGQVRNLLVMHEDVTEANRAESEVREANRQLRALLQSSRLLAATHELQNLLARTVTIVQEAMPASSIGGLFLYDAESDTLELRAPIGFEEKPGTGLQRVERGEGLTGRVFEEAQTIYTVSAEDQALLMASLSWRNREALLNLSGQRFPNSSVGVPIMAGGKFLGALVLYGVDPERKIERADVALLETLADHAAVAIENARLYEALQEQARELQGLNRRLRRAVEELKTLDEMKTNLLSNVSHELRTPLIAIMGYTDLMLQGKLGPLTDLQRERLQISMRNAQRLSKLIEDLLDFSRTEMGKVELKVVSFDVRDAVRDAVEMIRTKAEGRGIGIETVFPEGDLTVRGDRDKIGQVLSNLLSNAEKFNRDGGRIQIEVKPPSKGAVRINISDTGIGIPREEQEKIFDRFYQVDSGLARRYGGTGIGLALSRSIVALHGGQIQVKSEPDRGSTFTVSLPVYDESRDSGRFRMTRPPAGGSSG